MGILSNKIQRDQIQPGDHIYSWRTAYTYAHHGIYLGDNLIVHFTRDRSQEGETGTVLDSILSSCSSVPRDSPCVICLNREQQKGVIVSCIDCFLAGGDLYLFEYNVHPVIFIAKVRGGTCTQAKADPPAEVLHRARYLLENGFGTYHIFKNNCEDFAIYCKTGLLVETISVGGSGQATSFLAATSAVVSVPLPYMTRNYVGLTVVASVMYCVNRYVADIGIRRDVVKVPVERLIIGLTNEPEPLTL